MNSTLNTVAFLVARAALAAAVCSTVLLGALWPATAQSRAHGDVASRTVSSAGLDLRTQAGQAALMNRVRMAAQTVCLQDEETYGARNGAVVSCYQDALTRAEAQASALLAASRAVAANGK